MRKRDKFLTEAMGGCDHDWRKPKSYIEGHYCSKCDKYWPVKPTTLIDITNFSTWEGFGKLWSWAIEQDWWDKFIFPAQCCDDYKIHPDRFATAIYEYLKKETP